MLFSYHFCGLFILFYMLIKLNFKDHDILNISCYFKAQRSYAFALTGNYLAWNEKLPNYRTHPFKLLFTNPELLFTAEIETVRNVS